MQNNAGDQVDSASALQSAAIEPGRQSSSGRSSGAGTSPSFGVMAVRTAHVQQASSALEAGGDSQSTMRVKDIEADPPVRASVLYDQAYRLATMPRGKFDDFTQSAFWSAITSATGFAAGLYDLLSNTSTDPKWLDLAEVMTFAVCVALAITGVARLREAETSEQYLNKLFKTSEKP